MINLLYSKHYINTGTVAASAVKGIITSTKSLTTKINRVVRYTVKSLLGKLKTKPYNYTYTTTIIDYTPKFKINNQRQKQLSYCMPVSYNRLQHK